MTIDTVQDTTPSSIYEVISQFEAGALHVIDLPPDVLEYYELAELPDGVAIIGGAARAIAQKALLGESPIVRDIDLTVFRENLAQLTYQDLQDLSSTYMPDDARHGHGIGIESLEEYFGTRDFTINEVVVCRDKLLMTAEAKEALIHKIIEPTAREKEANEAGTNEKLAMKALVLEAVFQNQYGTGEVQGIDYDLIRPSMFFIALALNKAFQYGLVVTNSFIQRLEQLGLAYEDAYMEPVEFAKYLLEDTYNFTYRGFPQAEAANRSFDDIDAPTLDEASTALEWPYSPEFAHGIELAEKYHGRLPMGVNIGEEY